MSMISGTNIFAVTLGSGGSMLFGTDQSLVWSLSISGAQTLIAGSGDDGYANGLGTNARFRLLKSIAYASAGVLYVSDFNNHMIRVVTTSGVRVIFCPSSYIVVFRECDSLCGFSKSRFYRWSGHQCSFQQPCWVGRRL